MWMDYFTILQQEQHEKLHNTQGVWFQQLTRVSWGYHKPYPSSYSVNEFMVNEFFTVN